MSGESGYRLCTIFYYANGDTSRIESLTKSFSYNGSGRVIIRDEFKEGKSILAVCDGGIDVLNKLGDRLPRTENA